ncbi:MAG: DUF2062 domain-containing protein [Bauldia sp.]
MLFRRRTEEHPIDRLRTALWPRVSFSRSAQYFQKRVMRLTGSPHAVALGVAVGVAIAFTPFLGFHILIALLIAWLLGANLVAAALGTAVANPITIPFIWAATYRVGRIFVGGPRFRSGSDVPSNLAEKSLHAIWPVIKPMLIGSIPIGLAAGVVAYLMVLAATRGFRAVRAERLAARRRKLHAAAHPTLEGV